MATRRPVNPSRRVADIEKAPLSETLSSRSGPPSAFSVALIFLGAIFVVGYFLRSQDMIFDSSFEQGCLLLSGAFGVSEAFSQVEGEFLCASDVERGIPILKKAYGDSMRKVLHVGPSTCSVVSRMMKEEDTEAFGIEPYDIEDADPTCKRLVRRGLARVVDIKFPLPYRAKSFPIVIISDALDYLSPKYLNKTLPELARVSSDGLIIFTGHPRQHKQKPADKAKIRSSVKLRSATWWIRYFVQMGLEENEAIVKKFEQAAGKSYYTPKCQMFHLKPYL